MVLDEQKYLCDDDYDDGTDDSDASQDWDWEPDDDSD